MSNGKTNGGFPKTGQGQLGATHSETATSLNSLALLYKAQGRSSEAEPLSQRAARIFHTSLGVEHPQTRQVMENYISLLADLRTNGDVQALLHLLAQHEQDGPQEEGSSS